MPYKRFVGPVDNSVWIVTADILNHDSDEGVHIVCFGVATSVCELRKLRTQVIKNGYTPHQTKIPLNQYTEKPIATCIE